VWFLKFNSRATGSALWLRYSLRFRGGKGEGACWYAVFDAEEKTVSHGRWEEPLERVELGPGETLCRIGDSVLKRYACAGRGEDAEWSLSWKDQGAPGFSFVPDWLFRWGIAGTLYGTPASFARFRGEVTIRGKRHDIGAAPGCVGHL